MLANLSLLLALMKHQIFLNSRQLKPSKVLAQETGFKKLFSSVETVGHKQEITCC